MVPPPSECDERLDELICEYFVRRERTELDSAREWIVLHPEFAEPLARFFEAELDLERVTGSLRSLLQVSMDAVPDRTLGDYRLLRELGRGGMGVVYEAEQISLGRRVALKVLPFAGMLDERQLRRFKNEAQAAAMLKHPHIVSVYAIGCERGVHFYAMELVEGRSLAEVLTRTGDRERVTGQENEERRHPNEKSTPNDECGTANVATDRHSTFIFPPDTIRDSLDTTERPADRHRAVARLGVQATEALAYAHREGVIHRDIKPSNLLVDGDGTLWITDFGLARIASHDQFTCTGDVLGTLRYMSPEQLASGKIVDQRTDIYSLGLTLYELLAKRPAFGAEDREKLLQVVLTAEPTPLRKLDAGIPRDLETIVLKATTKDRDARYQTAAELADDLTRFLESRPIRARRTSQARRFRYWAKRNPYLAVTSAALLVLLLTLAAGGPLVALRYASLAKSEQAATTALTTQLEASRRQLYDQGVFSGFEAWRAGNIARVDELLKSQVPNAGQSDLREFCWRHLKHLLDVANQRTVHEAHQRINGIATSPDGRWLAIGTPDGCITLVELSSGDLHVLRGHADEVNALSFSKDGTLFTASDDKMVKRWDVETHSPIGPPLEHSGFVACLDISPDGTRLATGQADGLVTVWDVGKSRKLASAAAHEYRVASVRFSPDGQTIASGGDDHRLRRWTADTLAPLKEFVADRARVDDISFGASSDTVVVSGGEGVKVWDLNAEHELPGARLMSASAVKIAPINEQFLAVGSAKNSVSVVDLRNGYTLAEWPGHRDVITALAMAPNGKTLYSSSDDGTVRAWDVAAVAREAQFSAVDDFHWVGGLAFSPRGDQVVVATRHEFLEASEETAQVIDVRTGEVEVTFGAPLGRRDCVSWSPDGRWVATGGRHEVVVWDAATGERRLTVSRRTDQYFANVVWSPDGRWLAAGGCTERRRKGNAILALWRINSNCTQAHEVFRDDAPGPNLVYSLAFSPTSTHLAMGLRFEDCELRLLSLRGAEWQPRSEPLVVHPGWVCVVDFAGTDLIASTGIDRVVNLYSISEGRVVRSITSPDILYSMAVSPDGRTIVGGSAFYMHLWDAHTGNPLATMPIMPWVVSLRFSPDGKTLAWKGADKAVHFLRTE